MDEDNAKYKGTTVTGSKWRRAWRATMHNPHGGAPVIQFDEEQITELDGVVTSKNTETLSLTFSPNAEVPIYNPATGEKTGATITQREVFVALYSVYRTLAAARDAREKA